MSSRLFRPRSFGALAVAVPAALALAAAVPSGSALASGPGNYHQGDEFLQTNLVSDLGNQGAQITDPNLKNAWGLAFSPTSPLWVADNNSGLATIYHVGVGGGTVSNLGFTVTVPGGRASTGDGSSPTGLVFNPTSDFVVTSATGSAPAFFIFSSESGQITAWNPAADPITAAGSTGQLEFSSPTAVYKGLTMASREGEHA